MTNYVWLIVHLGHPNGTRKHGQEQPMLVDTWWLLDNTGVPYWWIVMVNGWSTMVISTIVNYLKKNARNHNDCWSPVDVDQNGRIPAVEIDFPHRCRVLAQAFFNSGCFSQQFSHFSIHLSHHDLEQTCATPCARGDHWSKLVPAWTSDFKGFGLAGRGIGGCWWPCVFASQLLTNKRE